MIILKVSETQQLSVDRTKIHAILDTKDGSAQILIGNTWIYVMENHLQIIATMGDEAKKEFKDAQEFRDRLNSNLYGYRPKE